MMGVGSPALADVSEGAAVQIDACPYIIPDQPRPSGVTIIGLVGVVLAGMALILALLGTVAQATVIFGLSPWSPDASIRGLIYFVLCFLLMLSFLQISVGLLRRNKASRRSFFTLAMLIMLLEVVRIATSIFANGFNSNYPIDFFKLVGLAYVIAGALYLQQKRIKAWFE